MHGGFSKQFQRAIIHTPAHSRTEVAEGEASSSNSLISRVESPTTPARSCVLLSMRSVTQFEDMGGCEVKKEEIAQRC
jgi:hypothetical protein